MDSYTYTINHDGNTYELKLNLKTVRQIEKVLNEGIIALIQRTGGMLPLDALLTIAGYGLYNENGNRISPAMGQEIAEAYMTENGYAQLVSIVVETLQRDCPFFFQVD